MQSKHIKTNPKVLLEYQRLQNDCLVQVHQNVLYDSCNMFTLSLLNVWSLSKHSIDIKSDSRLFKSDVIAFIEMHILRQESCGHIVHNLHPFILYPQHHSTDRYSSMAICTRHTVEISNYQYFSEINLT